MKLLPLLLVTTAISAAKMAVLKEQSFVIKRGPRSLEAMCAEEVMAARMDGDVKREKYYRSLMRGALDLADAISQFKASTPKEFHKAIDKAPLATAAAHPEFAPHFNPLLQAGANVCQPNEHGNTPLMYASFNNNPCWVMVLLDKGASKNMNMPNAAGLTALTHFYLSSELGVQTKALIKVLISYGAATVDPSTLPEKIKKFVHAATVTEIQAFAAKK